MTSPNYGCDGCGQRTLRPLLRWCPACYAERRHEPTSWSVCPGCGYLNGRHATTCTTTRGNPQ